MAMNSRQTAAYPADIRGESHTCYHRQLEADLAKAEPFRSFCDWVLFDAAMPPGAVLPGGRGEQFDWQILDGFTATYPWMLAGGLNPDNVANTITIVRPDAVDISSGVEIEKGVKDNQLITEFVTSVRGWRTEFLPILIKDIPKLDFFNIFAV